jgi:predicted  nucleic acid-binding Zn-ribbon protein
MAPLFTIERQPSGPTEKDNAMSDTLGVLDYLREQFARVHVKLDRLSDDVGNLKVRMTSFESQIALIHGDFANQSGRLDRIESRLDRIERRLDLADA